MSYERPIEVLNATLAKVRVIGGPGAEPWPHGSICKYDNGNICFTLGLAAEQFKRVLTLRFSVALEVSLQGDEYRAACQQQVLGAVRSFWDGVTSESSRVVEIQPISGADSSPPILSREI
jgi:hypothetical protein